MSDKTHIEWTDATWNPVTGCSKVSVGCKHCYAERDWVRLSANSKTRYFNRAFTDVQCHADVLDLPLRWVKPRRIFVNSMSDLFHEDVPDRFIDQVFAVMALAPRHTFQILTKRPERMRRYLSPDSRRYGVEHQTYQLSPDAKISLASNWPLHNVWLGVSVEDQPTADERIPLLLTTSAAVRWISAEPLLGPIDLRYAAFNGADSLSRITGIDWVVAGGESGPNARPMHLDWARSLRDQCATAGVPFLFKQWGEFGPAFLDAKADEPEPWRIFPSGIRAWGFAESMTPRETWPAIIMSRSKKRITGRLLDGIEHNGYPGPRHD